MSNSLVDELADVRSRDREKLCQVVEAAGGTVAWMRRWTPLLAEQLGALTLEEMASETRAYYRDGETRLESCRRCPQSGGRCAREQGSCIDPGLVPAMVDGAPGLLKCGMRWERHLQRRRIADCGVPASAAHYTWVPGDPEWVIKWARGVARGEGTGWSYIRAGQGIGVRIGAAVIKDILAHEDGERRRVRYANVGASMERLRAFWSDPVNNMDPLQGPREADVAILDGISPGMSRAALDAVDQTLVYRGDHGGMATLLIGPGSRDELAEALPNSGRYLREGLQS